MTRLPTERLATACWAFIVAKTTGWEPASLLDFRPLQRSDRRNLSTDHPQAGSRQVGARDNPGFAGVWRVKAVFQACILDGTASNRPDGHFEVIGH
jgi:hypothetical protein